MPRLTILLLVYIAAILCGSLFTANAQPTIQSFSKMPLALTQDNGQWDSQDPFRANVGGATMWFTKGYDSPSGPCDPVSQFSLRGSR